MWIYLNNSFLSIVQNDQDADLLHVRARKKDDIEAVFPNASVKFTPTGDYKYRTDVRRENVANALHRMAATIEYTNFKNSVKDHQRHDAYMDTWSAAHGLEAGRQRRGSMGLYEGFGETASLD